MEDTIMTECQKITTEILNRVKDSFIKRIDACINAESEQFEHLNKIDIGIYFYKNLHGVQFLRHPV